MDETLATKSTTCEVVCNARLYDAWPAPVEQPIRKYPFICIVLCVHSYAGNVLTIRTRLLL